MRNSYRICVDHVDVRVEHVDVRVEQQERTFYGAYGHAPLGMTRASYETRATVELVVEGPVEPASFQVWLEKVLRYPAEPVDPKAAIRDAVRRGASVAELRAVLDAAAEECLAREILES